MSVVINDFDVVPQRSDNESSDDEESAAPESPSLRPRDVLDVIDRAERRKRRLRAH